MRSGLGLGLWIGMVACVSPQKTVDRGDSGESTPGMDPRFDPENWPDTVGGLDRPAHVYAPTDWDGTSRLPVVVMLHGYGATGIVQDVYMQLRPRLEVLGAIYVLPDGLKDSFGAQYWNANPYCCDFDGSGVDDVGYLMGLIDELEASMPVDEDRILFTGHSNGGYMAHRLACEHPGRLAGIASLAGLAQPYGTRCEDHLVSVLQMHGDLDDAVPYQDSSFLPGARESVETYMEAGCTGAPESQGRRDYSLEEGDETVVERWSGCQEGLVGELWTLEGVGHVPVFQEAYRDDLVSWLMERRRVE
jgi:polyhydroxybutyrate depolymerase